MCGSSYSHHQDNSGDLAASLILFPVPSLCCAFAIGLLVSGSGRVSHQGLMILEVSVHCGGESPAQQPVQGVMAGS